MNKVALSTGAASHGIIYTNNTVAGQYTALAIFGAYRHKPASSPRVILKHYFFSILLKWLNIIIAFYHCCVNSQPLFITPVNCRNGNLIAIL